MAEDKKWVEMEEAFGARVRDTVCACPFNRRVHVRSSASLASAPLVSTCTFCMYLWLTVVITSYWLNRGYNQL